MDTFPGGSDERYSVKNGVDEVLENFHVLTTGTIGLDLNRIRSSGYVFQVEMAYVACRLGFRVTEIPIYFPDRELGESKMDIRIQIEAAMRVWQVRQRHHNLTPQMRQTQLPSETSA